MMTTDFNHIETIQQRLAAHCVPQHCNATPQTVFFDILNAKVDLAGLAAAADETFLHDVYGIVRHIDRSVIPAVLDEHFVPRVGFQKVGA